MAIKKSDINVNEDIRVQVGDSRAISSGQIDPQDQTDVNVNQDIRVQVQDQSPTPDDSRQKSEINVNQDPRVIRGDSRAILLGNIDPTGQNEIPQPNLGADSPTLPTASTIRRTDDTIRSREPVNQNPVIGDSSNIRNVDFLTGQSLNRTPGTDDSTQGNNAFLRFGQRIDGQDPTQGPVIGDTSSFLQSQTATGVQEVTVDQVNPLNKFLTGQGTGASKTGQDRENGMNSSSSYFRANSDVRSQKQSAPTITEDWRVRLGLLPDSRVFYKSTDSGIMAPLQNTDGVLFPYTPAIQMTYYADYQTTTPTHSNFPSRFYSSSEVRDVQVNATFTAQSTYEADYLMAVIHFLRSCTKMFYGQDGNMNGQPPPLVQMTGLGPHQFNGHKCVVQQFNYTLPENIDYVRTSAGGPKDNKTVIQSRAKLEGNGDQFGIFGIAGRIGRLLGIGATQGAENPRIEQTDPYSSSGLSRAGASYVPTKIELSITLLPVVSRQNQTQEYSTRGYATGENYKNKGHW